MPNLIHGQDPGGGLRPVQVDDNGNLSVDVVSGVTFSANVATLTSITDTVTVNQVSGSVVSTNVLQIAGTDTAVNAGVANAGTLRVVHVTDSALSAIATGDVASDGVDAGSPVKVGGQARQTNPTAVADADRVNFIADDLGRQVVTPYQVRDLVATAYLTVSTGVETVLLAGAASTLRDLVHVICANTSDAAVDLDFRSGTAGSVVFSVTVPADATSGFVPVVPIPQTEAAQAWTVDNAGSDVSGTTVNISALFINNV